MITWKVKRRIDKVLGGDIITIITTNIITSVLCYHCSPCIYFTLTFFLSFSFSTLDWDHHGNSFRLFVTVRISGNKEFCMILVSYQYLYDIGIGMLYISISAQLLVLVTYCWYQKKCHIAGICSCMNPLAIISSCIGLNIMQGIN